MSTLSNDGKREHDLHIIISSRRNTGKTLFALALISCLSKENHVVTGVDMTSTDPDLIRTLAFGNSIPIINEWRTVKPSSQTTILAPDDYYLLQGGPKSFWQQIQNVINNPNYTKSHHVIDTNFHIANIYSADQTIKTIVDGIINSKKQLYMWVLWNYEILLHDTQQMKIIMDFKNRFEQIKFIHVFNPGFVKNNRLSDKGVIELEALSIKMKDIEKEISEVSLLVNSSHTTSKDKQSLSEIMDELSEKKIIIERQLDHAKSKVPAEHFVQLPNLKSGTKVSDDKIFEIIRTSRQQSHSKMFNTIAEKIISEYESLPQNIIPLIVIDPNLELFSKKSDIFSSFEAVKEQLPDICSFVNSALVE